MKNLNELKISKLILKLKGYVPVKFYTHLSLNELFM